MVYFCFVSCPLYREGEWNAILVGVVLVAQDQVLAPPTAKGRVGRLANQETLLVRIDGGNF